MRLDYTKAAPEGVRAVYGLQNYISHHTKLEEKLLHLVEMRASQINGCAFCLHLHALQLRALGESEIRIDCLSTWEETDLYSDRERAALAWTETVTRVSETHVPDEAFEAAHKAFDERELADLTLTIAMINVWNRLAISFRQDPATAQRVIEQSRAAAAR